MRKKSRILKGFLATASILGLSLTIPVNEIYAAAVSQMLGDVDLTDLNTNFNPSFVDGNTIEAVNSGSIMLRFDNTYNIGAIRVKANVSDIRLVADENGTAYSPQLIVGSIAGTNNITSMTLEQTNFTVSKVTFTGSAGEGNIPAANDYSALSSILFNDVGVARVNPNYSTLNINAPITLNADINTTDQIQGQININDNVTITNTITSNTKRTFVLNIVEDKSLILSAANALPEGVGKVDFNFTGANSVLNIDGTNTTIRGAITNGANGTLNLNAGITTATTPTITTIHKTNIADNVTFNIDSINSNMDLLNNGTSIAFKGADSELDLVNTGGTDKQFTLYANLNPSDAEDEYGIIRVGATTNSVTIANNGGPYTIGQDNTHRLKEFEVKGAGNIVIDNTVFTKRFNMNSTGQVTLNQALDLGAGGNIAFGTDGTLVVNGVIGSITTFVPNNGTLTINSGNVSGTIGDNKNSLKVVNIRANPVTFSANVFAPVILIEQASSLTLAKGVKLTGSVSTRNDTHGVLILEQDSSVTDGVGAAGSSLERVEVGAGASGLGGDIYAEAVVLTDKTSVLKLEHQSIIHENITTIDGNNSGKLVFAADGTVGGAVGANGAVLEAIIFNGVDTIEGAAYAQTFTIANAAANVTVMGLMTGNVDYEADGTLAPEGIRGNIDFKGTNGTFNVNAGFAIDGAVLSTGGVGGILNFKGDGNVTQNVGADEENSPATINIQGDDATNVSIADDVFVGGINFTNGGKLQLSKNLTAKNIDFGAKGGTLEFDGNDKYIFNAVIANGQTGVLNALTTLIATDPTIGTLKTINIGKNDEPQALIVQVNNADLVLLSTANSSINFGDTNSRLVLNAPVDQTIKFAGSLKGIAGGGGIVFLSGNGHNLVIDGDKGVTLGSKGNELDALNIMGNVTITNNLDIHNINKLNIKSGAVFTDQSLTSSKIAEINIGEVAGAATYALDAVNGDFDFNTGGMKFIHEDSALDLKNSSNANDHTITLTGPLYSGDDQFGIVKLTTGNKDLTIGNNGDDNNTLGTEDHRLKKLDFVSQGNGIINLQAGIHVENILLDIHAITLNKVNANIKFRSDTVYTATGDIEGDIIDFQGKAGIINIADNVKIDSKVTSTGDTSGTLNFEGAGEVTKLITNIEMLKAGSGNVSLSAGGDYSIGEIQGNGNNNLTFGANSRLTTTYINKTGGQAVNLIFTDGGSVRNAVGSNAAVGDIIVKAGAVNFGSTVKSGNIIVSNGAEIEVNDNVTATDIAGENENDGTLKLNNKAPINITGTIGNNNSLGTIEVVGRDVTITGELKAQNILFSNAAQDTTLTLGAASQVTNITTAGNNIHTLAVTDFDTGNGAIGAEDHRLKAIEFIGNGLVTVNTKNFYSDVTAVNNGQGNVKLNIAGGITYSLGSKNNSLASIQISENSTIKGDVYSKEINIDAGKNIDFERGNNNRNAKNIIIQNVLIDRDLLPRSLQLFTYLTDIKADKLNFGDANSSANFKDAVLVNSEINGGGTIKFSENVWLKQEIKNIERLEFGPEKFAILEKNIKAATLVANKTNLVLLSNLEINADSQFTDSVLDLAIYELKHTGNVTYNGTLDVITYFDTTLQSGGHILVGNGANVDMSALDSLVIKVKSRSDITKITPDTKHEVILKEAGGNFIPAPQAKVTVDSSGEENRFVRWVSNANGLVLLANNDDGGDNPENPDPGDSDNGGGNPPNPGDGDNGGGNPGDGGVIVPIFDPKPIRDEVTGPIAPGLIDQLIGIGIGNESDAGKVLSNLGLTKNVSETLDRLGGRTDMREVSEGLGEFNRGEVENILTDISINMDSFVSSGINTRLSEVNNKDESTFTLSGLNKPNGGENRGSRTNQAAVAAGDEDNIGTGIWLVPFYGKATQKFRNNGASGYKSKSQGGIIGFDYALSGSVIVGAAYTRADSKLRHQDYKVGDRTKAISDIYSIYGLYNCEASNFFVEAIGSYGRSKIKNYEKRKVSTGDQTAIGKFTNTSYSGELLGGYNYLISNLTAITPMIGTRYATFKNNSYTEVGTTFQNLSVRKKLYNRFEGIAGLKGVTHFLVQDIIIKPEVHGFINYDFRGKLPNTDARLDGIDEPLATVRFKPTKLNYNLGGSLSTKYNAVEFGIRYNLSLAKKYIANQGSLKIKVNL